jgi:hypothetical protein
MNNNTNNFNHSNDFDDVPEPIQSRYDTLIDNQLEDFEMFKNKILLDKTIDNDIKQILINSRKDEIDKFYENTKYNIENTYRSNIIRLLIIKLKEEKFDIVGYGRKEYLLNQINKWIEGKIQKIILESETLYELIELIDSIKSIYSDFEEIKIKNIFEPKNMDDYILYSDTMNLIKADSIKYEQMRLDEEENKIKLIKFRKNLLETLIFNLKKLSFIDDEANCLKNELKIPITKFLELKTNYIELEEYIGRRTIRFINSIRITEEKKENIMNLIKIIL